jgi:hypothetical protein
MFPPGAEELRRMRNKPNEAVPVSSVSFGTVNNQNAGGVNYA